MEWTQALAIIGSILFPMIAGFWAFFVFIDNKFTKIDGKFTNINDRLNDIDRRLSKIEGEMEHQKGMMQTIVAFLLGHKAG